MKTPSAELTSKIHEYASRNRGKVINPIPHPAFSSIRYKSGPERFDLIAPHLEYPNGTVLDIGSNWGYMAHRLEELGYKVTAVEHSATSAYFLREIRDVCDRKFKVIHDSIFNLTKLDYDIVLALNVFHHFMKTKEAFEQFEDLLARLNCRMLIFQAHHPSESQMAGAYRNMAPEQAAQFLSNRLSLPRVVEIGSYRKIASYKKMLRTILRTGSFPPNRRLFKLSE